MPYKPMALHAIDRFFEPRARSAIDRFFEPKARSAIDRFFEPKALRAIGNGSYARRRHQLHVLGQPAAGEG
jgi:hypothetical protein